MLQNKYMIDFDLELLSIKIKVSMESPSNENVFIIIGDFFTPNHYLSLRNKLLNDHYNVFIIDYSCARSEKDAVSRIVNAVGILEKKYCLSGKKYWIGHSKGAHLTVLISQLLNQNCVYILMNPLIRVKGIKEKRQPELFSECIKSAVLYRNIKIPFKLFSERFLDDDLTLETKREIYNNSIPMSIRFFFFTKIIEKYISNKYYVMYSAEDKAIDHKLLKHKIKVLKLQAEIEFYEYKCKGGHCSTLFSDVNNNYNLIKKIIKEGSNNVIGRNRTEYKK